MKIKKIIIICLTLLISTTAISAVGSLNLNNSPNDPGFPDQWGLHNTGQTGGISDVDIDALEGWDIETGDSEIIIAIIDSGIDYTHPDLIENIWINEDEIPDNGIDDDNNGYVDDYKGYDFKNDDADTLDEHGHGTVIAGVIGAVGNNNIGIAGVCWDCQIMPLKWFNTNSRMEAYVDRLDNIMEAIEYAADNGAHIISMSLGADESFFESDELLLLKDAVDYAFEKGCVLVAAALNEDTSEPYYPGAWDNVICVGAIDQNNSRMDYQYPDDGQIVISNYGEWVDVAAPGEEIFTTSPLYDCVITDLGRENEYTLMSGTSLATPFVAGLAGLLLSHDSTLTNDEIIDIIRANVDPYNSDKYLGTGRINAEKALTRFNTKPNKPEIEGPTNGKSDMEYTFAAICSDPDGDDLYYKWDWGEGNFSEWLDSNEASYSWENEAIFNISVMTKDVHGAESDWSDPFEFSTPKNKTIINWLYRFFQRFPLLDLLFNLL
jgi:subtilisin family serine protease